MRVVSRSRCEEITMCSMKQKLVGHETEGVIFSSSIHAAPVVERGVLLLSTPDFDRCTHFLSS